MCLYLSKRHIDENHMLIMLFCVGDKDQIAKPGLNMTNTQTYPSYFDDKVLINF